MTSGKSQSVPFVKMGSCKANPALPPASLTAWRMYLFPPRRKAPSPSQAEEWPFHYHHCLTGTRHDAQRKGNWRRAGLPDAPLKSTAASQRPGALLPRRGLPQRCPTSAQLPTSELLNADRPTRQQWQQQRGVGRPTVLPLGQSPTCLARRAALPRVLLQGSALHPAAAAAAAQRGLVHSQASNPTLQGTVGPRRHLGSSKERKSCREVLLAPPPECRSRGSSSGWFLGQQRCSY